jgi:arylsulfatase A-like enzyme
MTRRSLLGGLASALTVSAARKPNIVFFLADDLGRNDLGCYGSTFHETPNIDRMAAQGMQFMQAYAACPVCSPTRISILTGKYPARTGVTTFIPGNQDFPRAAMKAVTNKLFMDPSEVTLAEALKATGYATACIGKWHLGGGESDADRQGFDLYAHRGARKGDTFAGTPNLAGAAGEFMTDRYAKTAVDFIRMQKDKPFFLYLPFNDPHIPLEAKPDYIAKYQAKLKRAKIGPAKALNSWPGAAQNNPIYAGMIQSVDEAVGTVLGEIAAQGLANDTIAVFFSDNGGLTVPEGACMTPTSNAPMREGKGHLYEGGVREPLLVRWPGVVKAGSRCETPVVSTDFFPTLREATGASGGNPLDGVSILPLLKQTGAIRREAIYWHYPHYANQLGVPAGAIRKGDWKLIEFFGDGKLELYNVAKDIGERHDLAAKMPARVKELHEQLKTWRQQVGAKMPAPNPNYDPARKWDGLGWYERCRPPA